MIAMLSPDELTYLLDTVHNSYAMNATPIIVKRIVQASISSDQVFSEKIQKTYVEFTVSMIVVGKPSSRTEDWIGAVTEVELVVAVSKLSAEEAGWIPDPEDIIRYRNEDGITVDYYIKKVWTDGVFRDTAGRETTLAYSIGLTSDKAPTG